MALKTTVGGPEAPWATTFHRTSRSTAPRSDSWRVIEFGPLESPEIVSVAASSRWNVTVTGVPEPGGTNPARSNVTWSVGWLVIRSPCGTVRKFEMVWAHAPEASSSIPTTASQRLSTTTPPKARNQRPLLAFFLTHRQSASDTEA
jgi:hypothetical protein